MRKSGDSKYGQRDGTADEVLPSADQPVLEDELTQLVTLFDGGRYAELEGRTQLLVKQYPNIGIIWTAMGLALQMQGKKALHALKNAIALLPDVAEAHSNLGNSLRDLGQLNDAVISCRRALTIKPDYPAARSNLGNAMQALGQLNEAVASYRQALEIKPDFAEVHNNLGNVLQVLGQLDNAMMTYRHALEIKHDYAEAHNNLGNALKDLGRFDDAVASCRLALGLRPDYADAQNNLGLALHDRRQLDEAVATFRRALAIKPEFTDAFSNLLFSHNYQSDHPPTVLLAEARRFGVVVAQSARLYTDWPNTPEHGRCLRVGFVSGDLRNHPVGYFVESMLSALAANARGGLELFAYASHFPSDALTERIKSCCRGWHSAVGLSDEVLARRIRDDRIDILIDLSGHTAHNRLPMFAWKPAPVQATWLGYFATTGVAAVDYLIADPWTLPAVEEANFTEKIWRLPETRLCFTPPDADVHVATLPALYNGYVTFGCFSNLTKMNEGVVTLWARVLATVPGSRLFLKGRQLCEASARQEIVTRFADQDVDPSRLLLEGLSPRAEYLSAYGRVDIVLDTFPFPGGTTSIESLWMGVPVLTLAGERFLGRQGVGLMMNAGMSEWVANDPDDYVTRAASHASDLQYLADLRNRLRQQVLGSPLFDAPRFARHFEAALRDMWEKWCNE